MSVLQLLENVPGEIVVDFAVPGHGLGDTRLGILVPIVLAAVPNEPATGFFELADQVGSFHDETESSATLRIPGMSPLVKSP